MVILGVAASQSLPLVILPGLVQTIVYSYPSAVLRLDAEYTPAKAQTQKRTVRNGGSGERVRARARVSKWVG